MSISVNVLLCFKFVAVVTIVLIKVDIDEVFLQQSEAKEYTKDL